MTLYRYKGYDKNGKEISGVLEAPDRKSAQLSIRSLHILPFQIEEVGKKGRRWIERKPDIGYLFFQIGIMLKCGLPLTRAIEVVIHQSPKRGITGVLNDIKKEISEGRRFSDALSKYPKHFPEVYVNMVRIAEATGGLSDLLLNIAKHEEQRKEQEARLKNALTYPMVVALIGSGIVGFLLMYVVPKMIKIFSSVEVELPLSTRLMIYTGAFLRDYGIYITAVLGLVLVIFYRFYYHKNEFKERIDRILIKFDLYKKSLMARLTEILAFQLGEGIPLILALRASKGIIPNLVLQKEIERLSTEIEKGKSFSEAIRHSVVFDEMFKAAITTGESTGELTGFLEKISHYFRKDVERVTKRALSVAEPVMILILGLIVGFIVLSIMLPIFDLNQMIK